jgi:hypothetical protein
LLLAVLANVVLPTTPLPSLLLPCTPGPLLLFDPPVHAAVLVHATIANAVTADAGRVNEIDAATRSTATQIIAGLNFMFKTSDSFYSEIMGKSASPRRFAETRQLK